jgi:HTH-type transcriptional regulator/antitoxin HigA
LIPEEGWRDFARRGDWSAPAVNRAAITWNIHPAIVAGRVRRKTKNHRILTALVGYNTLRPSLLN